MEVLNKYSSRELRSLLSKCLTPIIAQLGFKRHNHYFIKEYKDGVFGLIGISGSSCGDKNTLYCTLYVGMAQKDVSKMINDLVEYSRSFLFEGWQGISDIIPDGKYKDYEWKISSQADIDVLVQRVLQLATQIILPFFEENCCKSMYRYNIMSGRFADNSQKDRIIPILYYLDGDKQRGINYVESRIRNNPDKAYCDLIDKVFLDNYYKLP